MATEETLEQKVKRLEGENKTALDLKDKAEKSLANLTTKYEAIALENATLTAALAELQTKYNQLVTDRKNDSDAFALLEKTHDDFVRDSVSEIEKLSAELASAKSDAAASIVSATVDGVKYQVLGKVFNIPGKGIMTTIEILKDKALLKELVASGAGFLVPAK